LWNRSAEFTAAGTYFASAILLSNSYVGFAGQNILVISFSSLCMQ
jgi:hypothetical protein